MTSEGRPAAGGAGVVAGPDPAAVPARLRWRCRRGMRELDLLMLGWLERHWTGASSGERSTFEALVEEADHDILAWILGRSSTPERYAGLVASLARLLSAGAPAGPGQA